VPDSERDTEAQHKPEVSAPSAAPAQAAPDPRVERLLRLQRTAGNAAVGRLVRSQRVLAREPGSGAAVTFKDPELQKIYDANKPGTLAQQVALQLLDGPRSGPWKGLSWPAVAKGLAERVYRPEMIDQKSLGTCGPASVLNANASHDATDYVMVAIELFETGKLKGEKVNDTLLGKSAPSGMDPSDFMLMSSIQDRMNTIFEYHGEPGFREGGGSGTMRSNLKKYSGVVEAVTHDCGWWGVLKEAQWASDLIKNNPKDIIVMMHLSADVLQDPTSKENPRNHVIRLLGPISITDVEVKFDAFTWGAKRSYTFKVKDFERMMYAFTAGSRKAGLL
jgi:hypothetical protein